METSNYPRQVSVVSTCDHGQLFPFFNLLYRKRFLLFFLILSLFVHPTLRGQTKTELNTLFFDGVYLDDPETILLSSAARNSGKAFISPPANLPITDEEQISLNDQCSLNHCHYEFVLQYEILGFDSIQNYARL